jgi:3',5'-cyclic AMP phosphodiesterase CpdA
MPYRPIFFQVGESHPFSGWQSENWARVYVHKDAVSDLISQIRDGMICAALTELPALAPYDIVCVSDVLTNIQPALEFGARLKFTRRIDLTPHTVIEEGERGVVAHVEPIYGQVSIFLEHFHPGFWEEGSNFMWLIPHMTDELLSAVEVLDGKHVEAA